MLIAEEKEKENIVEYILYMWQMEDLVRANNLDLDAVMLKLFPEDTPSEVVEEYRTWFGNIIAEMHETGLQRSGHIKSVRKYMDTLQSLHNSLITTYQDQKYIDIFNKSKSDIKALRSKGMSPGIGEIEVCLVGLYGILLLRMSQTAISADTEKSIRNIGTLMSYLSDSFQKRKNGDLDLPSELKN